MKPDILTLPPGMEVEYGTYILSNPFAPGRGMANTRNEYLEGWFVYREGNTISRPKIDVRSNRIGWKEIDSK